MPKRVVKKFFSRRQKPTVYEVFTSGFIVYLSLVHGGRGLIWMLTGDKVIESAEIYKKMAEVMPIQTWGLLFLISGLFLFTAAFTHGTSALIFLMIGSLFGVFCNGMMYMAGTVAGVNAYTPFLSALQLITSLSFLIAGGFMIWNEKKKQIS